MRVIALLLLAPFLLSAQNGKLPDPCRNLRIDQYEIGMQFHFPKSYPPLEHPSYEQSLFRVPDPNDPSLAYSLNDYFLLADKDFTLVGIQTGSEYVSHDAVGKEVRTKNKDVLLPFYEFLAADGSRFRLNLQRDLFDPSKTENERALWANLVLPGAFFKQDLDKAITFLKQNSVWYTRFRFGGNRYEKVTIAAVEMGKPTVTLKTLVHGRGKDSTMYVNFCATNVPDALYKRHNFYSLFSQEDPLADLKGDDLKFKTAIQQGRVEISMSPNAVELSLGKPDSVSFKKTEKGEETKWKYKSGTQLTFTGGSLMEISKDN